MDAAMAEEVNYASVVFKSGKQAPPQAKKEEETVYDQVKVKSETTEQPADTNDEKENKKRRRYQKLACCLGILCVILLVGLVAVVVILATLSGENNETTLQADIRNLTNLNNKLSVDNDHLRMEHSNLTVQLSNLTNNYNVLENNITNLTTQNQELETRNQELETQNQELKNQTNNLTQQIQDMEMNWNEHNISRAQWSIDTYCPKDKGRTCTTCRKDWEQRGNSCYVYNNAEPADQITWEEARERCRVKNADLAVAHNEEEKNSINDVKFGDAYWIGLRVEGGLWKWIDGSKLIDSSWIGEPTEGHCAVSKNVQPWTSAPCGDRKQWICIQGALSL